MIVLCQIPGFLVIEPMKELNSTGFKKDIYRLFMRYILCHIVVTDLDSKFKGEIYLMVGMLIIKHHMCARGHHDTIMIEQFNQ